MAPGTRLFLAGSIRLESAGRALDETVLGGSQPRLVLAMLALEHQRPVSREELAEALWPNRLPRTWEPALRGVVSRVRTFLDAAGLPGDDAITASFGSYQLHLPDGATIDVELEPTLVEASTALAAGDTARALALATEAEQIGARPFLSRTEGAWVESVRRRLLAQRIQALTISVDASLVQDDASAAIKAGEALLSLDPFNEDAYRRTMRAYAAAGNRAEALWVYERCRTLLDSELGTDPSPETQAVHLELLRSEAEWPSAVPGAASLQPEFDPRRQPALVGRADELSLLRDALRRAIDGCSTLVLVTGPAGAGKTRLVSELAAEAIRQGAVVGGSHASAPSPFLDPILNGMRWILGSLPADALDDIDDTTLDAVATLLGDGWHPALGGRANGRGVSPQHTLDALVGAVSGRRPVVLIADGVYSANTDLLAMLRALTDDESRRLLVIVTTRDGEPPAVFDHDGADHVRLAAMDGPLMRGFLGADADDESVAILEAEARGLPGRAVDIVRFLDDRHRPETSADRVRRAVGRACPYKGLLAYEPEDADRFLGRDDVLAEISERIGETPLVAIVGLSGCGKSSLVRAGVVPLLRDRAGDGRIVLLHPGPRPLEALRTALGDGRDCGGVVVDQFEELFVMCGDRDVQTAFCDLLIELSEETPVVITIRADAYGALGVHRRLADLSGRGTVLVRPMDLPDLHEVITESATMLGYLVEPGLSETVLAEIGNDPAAALPLLSHVLRETWRNRSSSVLSLDAYRATGGAREAIARTAEDVLTGLAAEEQTFVRDVLLQLVAVGEGIEDSRRIVARTDLLELARDDCTLAAEVLERLVRARLLTIDANAGVTLAHESLIRHWPRLSQWLDESRDSLRIQRHLSSTAAEWERLGRPQSELYRGERLAAVGDWMEREHPTLIAGNKVFVDASVDASTAEADRQRRSAQRLRRLLGAVVAVAVVAAAAGGFAVVQRNRSRGAAQLAQVRGLAAEANAIAKESPALALNLAAEAYKRRPDLVETRGSLLTTLLADGKFLGFLGNAKEVRAVAGSDSGLAALTTGDEVQIWNVSTAKLLRKIPFTDAIFKQSTLAFAPGDRLVAVRDDGTLSQWDARTGRQLGPAVVTRIKLPIVDVDDAGHRALVVNNPAAVTSSSEASIVDLRTGRVTAGPYRFNSPPLSDSRAVGALSGDGKTIALVTTTVPRAKAEAVSPVEIETRSASDMKPIVAPVPLPGAGQCCLWDIDLNRDGSKAIVPHLTNANDPPLLVDFTKKTATSLPPSKTAATDTGAFVRFRGNDALLIGREKTREILGMPDFKMLASVPIGGVFDGIIAGGRLVVGGSNPTVWSLDGRGKLWSEPIHTGGTVWDTAELGSYVSSISFGNPNTVKIFGTTTGKLIGTFKGDAWPLKGDLIRWVDAKGRLRILDFAGNQVRPSVELGAPANLGEWDAVDANGRYVAWTLWKDGEGIAYVNDLRTGKRMFKLRVGKPHSQAAFESQGEFDWFSRDGTLLAVLGSGHLAVFSMPDGRKLWDVSDTARYALFSGDNRLVLASRQNEAVLRDARTGKIVGSALRDITGSIGWGQLNSTGKLAVLTTKTNVQLFDIDSGQRLGPAIPIPLGSEGLFSGNVVVFDTDDGMVNLPLDPNVWSQAACRAAGSNMSRAEWRQYLPLDRSYRPTCAGLPIRS